jgi:hypothetical protein
MWRAMKNCYCLLGLIAAISIGSVSCGDQTNNGEPLLKVSAAKGPLGVQLTIREDASVHDCTVTLLDQGSATWVADVKGPFVRSETVRVAWSQFKDNGQPMPSSIGVARKNLIVDCQIDGIPNRRSAGLHFSE